MKMKTVLAVFALAMTSHVYAADRVFFPDLKDGAEVASPVKVHFGLEGMEIGKVGDLTQGKGHHHLIIDGKPIEKGQVVPNDATHMHFGKGQTETEVKLEPGDHTLTLQFADGAHRSYGPEMSSTIHVRVKAGSGTSSDSSYKY